MAQTEQVSLQKSKLDFLNKNIKTHGCSRNEYKHGEPQNLHTLFPQITPWGVIPFIPTCAPGFISPRELIKAVKRNGIDKQFFLTMELNEAGS